MDRKKQIIMQTGEACSNMIVGVRQLRLSVLDLFTTLADNGPDPHRNQQIQHDNLFVNDNKLYHQQTLSNLATSHSLCTSSTPPLRVQKQQEQQQQLDLLQYVNQMISSITATIRNLDKEIMILTQNQLLISPGESIHIGLADSVDKHNLYMDLCKSYKTYTKLHDYSANCHALLHQQSLKRVHKRLDGSSGASAGGAGMGGQQGRDSTRPDSVVATFNPYAYRIQTPKSSIIDILEACLKACEHMDGTYSQPFGVSTGVFQITLNRVLKAILVMRGIMIDAVIVKAYHESFASKHQLQQQQQQAAATMTANKGGVGGAGSSAAASAVGLLLGEAGGSPFVDPDDDIDLWSESKYAVFRKLTHHANAAVLHFQYPTFPEIAVRSFLSWFNSYSELFSATCSRCNSKLRKFMPPICRDFSSGFHPHHDSCK